MIATTEAEEPFFAEKTLWTQVLAAQMTGSKAGASACRAFWFSRHCGIICAFLGLSLEKLQQAALDPSPMFEPSAINLYCDPAEKWRREHGETRRRKREALRAAADDIETGWQTGPKAMEATCF
jgi:hypothetical protein